MANRLFPAPQRRENSALPRLFRGEEQSEEVRVLFPAPSQEPMPDVHTPMVENEEPPVEPTEVPQEPEEMMAESIEPPMEAPEVEPAPAVDNRQEIDAMELANREEQMRDIIDVLSRWKEHFIQQSRADSIEVAFMVAEKIIHRELERDPAIIQEFIETAYEQAAESERVTLFIHPLDRQLVQAEDQAEPNIPGLPAHLRIEEDESLTRGDCILESDLETIDGRLQVRLDALAGAARQALAPAPNQERS